MYNTRVCIHVYIHTPVHRWWYLKAPQTRRPWSDRSRTIYSSITWRVSWRRQPVRSVPLLLLPIFITTTTFTTYLQHHCRNHPHYLLPQSPSLLHTGITTTNILLLHTTAELKKTLREGGQQNSSPQWCCVPNGNWLFFERTPRTLETHGGVASGKYIRGRIDGWVVWLLVICSLLRFVVCRKKKKRKSHEQRKLNTDWSRRYRKLYIHPRKYR